MAAGGANWVGLYMKRSPESACPCVADEEVASRAGDETKSDGADESIIAGEGTKNCGVANDGVAAGNGSRRGKGLLTELILMLDGLT